MLIVYPTQAARDMTRIMPRKKAACKAAFLKDFFNF
jgi:hypothetical protein